MPPIDLSRFFLPVSDDEPAGPNQEYHPTYLAAFRAAEGTPSRQMGDTLVLAEEPDWSRVVDLALDLLAQSKDLRVAVLLARALLSVQGIQGLNDGLTLINGIMSRYWEALHPQLDPDDDNDPTARVNCLVDLCDREQLLDALRSTPLVRSNVFGAVAYRDVEIAEGRVNAPQDGKSLDAAALDAAFQDCDIDELKETEAAADGALGQARAVLTTLGERIRDDQMPNMDPLIDLLSAIHKVSHAHLSQRLPDGAEPAQGGEVSAVSEHASPQNTPQPNQARGTPGQITSRDDVVRAIDRICDYYIHHEPSSPVPLLLRRAQRLATGDFLDIMRDLAPDALAQIETVCGPAKES